MTRLTGVKKGDTVALIGTVERVQEGHQHADYIVIRLDVEPHRHEGNVLIVKAHVDEDGTATLQGKRAS
jgi:hypothetical protein